MIEGILFAGFLSAFGFVVIAFKINRTWLRRLLGYDIYFDVAIVDEASKSTITETLVPFMRSKRFILIGDQKQLPPTFPDADELRRYKFDIPLYDPIDSFINKEEAPARANESVSFLRLKSSLSPEAFVI